MIIIDIGRFLSMAEGNGKNGKNGKRLQRAPAPAAKISKFGQRLREMSDKALASGTKVLSSEEIHQLLCEIRGGH